MQTEYQGIVIARNEGREALLNAQNVRSTAHWLMEHTFAPMTIHRRQSLELNLERLLTDAEALCATLNRFDEYAE